MKVVVTDIHRIGDSLVANGYFDNGTRFHGVLEEPLLSEARALFARIGEVAAERLKERERAYANQLRQPPYTPSPSWREG